MERKYKGVPGTWDGEWVLTQSVCSPPHPFSFPLIFFFPARTMHSWEMGREIGNNNSRRMRAAQNGRVRFLFPAPWSIPSHTLGLDRPEGLRPTSI